MKIALCIPVHGDTKAHFTMSALALVMRVCRARSDIELLPIMHNKGSRIDHVREMLAARALQVGAEHLLWLDADQTFSPDTLERLLARRLPFVGCNYRKRDATKIESTARRSVSGEMVGIKPKKSGVEPVDILGFGVALTAAAMFKSLPRPWFASGPHGEDGYFCEQAIKAGCQPHVDHALSMEVGHIAETVLRFPA